MLARKGDLDRNLEVEDDDAGAVEQMMKKFLVGLLVVVIVGGAGIFVFRGPLIDALTELATADMFVAADSDSYDPGLPVGARLPALLALHEGDQVVNLTSFAGSKGIVLYAVRSVDW